MRIDGEKVRLTEGITEDGYVSLLKWFTDLEVMRYIGFARRSLKFGCVGEVRSFVSELSDGIFFEMYCGDRLIGYTALSHFEKKDCELGIVIGEKDYWNKGIGQEASRLTVDYAFDSLGIERVVLSTCGLHESAVKCYEVSGFRVYDIKRNAREVFHEGNWVKADTVKMEKLRG